MKQKSSNHHNITANAIQQFNQWSSTYDTGITNLFFQYTIKRIKQSIDFKDNIKVLDVGCGTGNLLLEIGKDHRSCELQGIDISPKMIQTANSKIGKLKNVSFQIGNGDNLPYDSNYFDYVICSHSLHHHPKPEKSLVEMTRVLTSGGKLILVDGITDGIFRRIVFFITRILQNEDLVQRFKKLEIFDFFQKLKYTNIEQQKILYFNLLTKGIKAPDFQNGEPQ